MKTVIAALLSAAIIHMAHVQAAPVLTIEHSAPKTQTVRVAVTEKTVSSTQTEPSTIVQPETQVPTGCAAYVALLKQYDWNVSIMAAIMQAESGCDPNANNHGIGNYDHIPDYGLLQLHGQEIYDPAINICLLYTSPSPRD